MSHLRRAAARTGLVLAAAALAAPAGAQPQRSVERETVTKIAQPFTVAAVGDIIMLQPLNRSDPGFQQLIGTMRKADVGFANMESSLIDLRTFPGPVAGTPAPLATGEAIKAMGINLMSRANNHTFDGGLAGMVSTNEALDRLGIAHAGTGRDLQEARAAGYLETPKGRVGLVSMFSVEDVGNFGPTYTRTLATRRDGPFGGAAGVNPLRLTTYHVVSPEHLESLKRTALATYGERTNAAQTGPNGVQRFRFFDEWYEAGSDAGALRYDMDARDRREILDSIRNGKIYADFLIATIHVHQTPKYCGQCSAGGAGSGMKEGADHYPADFLVKLARDSIDHGADMFVAHGVHAMAGVEIYKGKPIFYGLSNFVFQFGLQPGESSDVMDSWKKMSALEDPATQEAVLTTSRFDGGRLVEVRLHPVDLGGARRPISTIGVPAVPTAAEAQRILRALQEYSTPFGTRIAIEGNIGVIRLPGEHSGK